MSATLHYTHGRAFAVAEVTALAFVENAEPVLEELAQHTRDHGDRCLLINLMDVIGTFGHDEQQVIGLLAYRYLSHLERVASLVPEEKITRVSETAARAQGMELKVFTVLSEAVEWLVQG